MEVEVTQRHIKPGRAISRAQLPPQVLTLKADFVPSSGLVCNTKSWLKFRSVLCDGRRGMLELAR